MHFIVETEEQISRLETMVSTEGCFIHILTTNDYFHPALSGLVALYVRPLHEEEIIEPGTGNILGTEGKGYIIPIQHDEGINVPKERVEELLKNSPKLYVLDKKAALYHFTLGKNTVDLNLKYVMNHSERLQLKSNEMTCNWFYNRYGDEKNLNQIIPIAKLYERCESVFNEVRPVIGEEEPSGFTFYNEYATKAYYMVERSGIRVDIHNFIERFKPGNENFSIGPDGKVYTSYNLYNVTSRPTNSFNGVNFLAIPKGQEFRKCFMPSTSGGKFVEMDFDGYHIRIVSDLVNYQLSLDKKAHKQLAEARTGKSEFTQEEYVKAKAENFKMVYGSPSEEDSKLEISIKVQNYIKDLWKQFTETGKITNKQSNREFAETLGEMYPNKLFNYLIQSLETSRNTVVLCRLLKYLSSKGCKSKIILITYDSFLIDLAEGEDGILEDLKSILEGRLGAKEDSVIYPVGIKESYDLCFD